MLDRAEFLRVSPSRVAMILLKHRMPGSALAAELGPLRVSGKNASSLVLLRVFVGDRSSHMDFITVIFGGISDK